MRRASGIRVSPPQICIFCATRRTGAGEPWTIARRQLNSSSRAPQSAEAMLYKEDNAPAKPMSQAERMRQQLAAGATFAPSRQPQGGYKPPAYRPKPPNGPQRSQQVYPQAQRPSQPDRRHMGRDGFSDTRRANQNREPFARRAPVTSENNGFQAPQQSRFRINMDAKPEIDMPLFDSAQLKRHTAAQHEPAQPKEERRTMYRPGAPARKNALVQDEIDELLNNASSNRTTKSYQPLARDMNAQRKCFHCGSIDHLSGQCPSKPVLRERQPRQQYKPSPQSTTTTAEAAEAWQKRANFDQIETQPSQTMVEADRRTRNIDQDRRRSRFEMDDGASRNRYEEPERRRGGMRNRGQRSSFEQEEEEERTSSKVERKRQRKEAKKAAQLAKAEPTRIQLPEYISVANLATMLKLRVEDFVMKLEELGFEDVQNDHILNSEHAGLIAQEYNFEPIFVQEGEDGDLYPAPELSPEEYAELPARPPVVTIMGHVDHGKTTILDYMRSTSVAATEFGGITQHIGAFSVPLANGKKITFLDTPGHSAFETMRARGANVTDIVVLVVAADDSVMPQTVEAIKHAQAAKVPMIVAINKIDKQQADPDAVKLDLGRHGIEIEDFGGDIQAVCVSGKTGQGIPDLEEAISTLSEMLDHRADPEAAIEGWVLEGNVKKSGRTATVLLRSGTLKQGSMLVAGTTWTRVRSLRNEAGVAVEEAGPGMAVEVDGWRDQPIAGDEVLEAEDEQHASSVAELRMDKVEKEQMARDVEAINEARRQEAERAAADEEAVSETATTTESGPEVISFIVKGDVSGSVEAVIDSVSALGNGEVSARILRYGVGSPSEFDVSHAADARGHIINFNTAVPSHVQKMAEEKGVRILDSNIIYRVVENVKELLSEKLKPNVIQKVIGEVEIAAVFEIGLGGKKKLRVAGSKVRNGVVDRGTKARVLRGDKVVHVGVINSLRNQKKDVEQMRKDTECGISFENWEDFKVGDKVQCYEEKFEKRHL